jgi:Zn-dependent protease
MIESKLQILLIAAIPIIFAIVLHEVAHGWIAKLHGDSTAEKYGRLTLNPVKHIDPIGTLLVPALLFMFTGFIFGWAKPVPISWNQLNQPKPDMAKVAIAGPVANLIMAFFWGIIIKITTLMLSNATLWVEIFYIMARIGIMINIILLVLNLIPIPPLDGSRVVTSFLPNHLAIQYNKLEKWGFLILLAFLIIPVNGMPLIWYIMSPFIQFFMRLIGYMLQINIA